MSSCFLIALITTVIFATELFVTMRMRIFKEAEEENSKTLSQIAGNVDSVIESAISLTNIYYFDPEMRNILCDLNKMTPAQLIRTRGDYEERFRYYNNILDTKLCYASIMGRDSIELFQWNAVGYEKGFRLTDEVLSQIDAAPNRLVCLPSQKTYGNYGENAKEVFYIVRKFLDPYSPAEIGIMVLGIDENVLYQRYSQVLEKGYDIFIIDNYGNVLSSKDKAAIGKPAELPEMNLGKAVTLKRDGRFIMTFPIERIGWTVVQSVSTKKMLSPVNTIYPVLILTILFCIILSFIISYHMAKSMTEPLMALTQAMKEVDGDRLHVEVHVDSNDEIQILANGFNDLIVRIEQLMESLRDSEKRKRRAEYEVLQAQINPHFLFNTLSVVRCLIMDGDADQANKTLIALGKLLRNTILKYDEQGTVDQECKNLDYYVQIQQARYQNGFKVIFEIPETVRSCRIIKMVLQPLVENAIFHGIDPHDQEAVIRISAYEEGDKIRISVADNGIGMNENEISGVFRERHGDGEISFSSIGIPNIAQRLKLFYGEGYGVNIRSSRRKGTEVSVLIPRQTGPDGGKEYDESTDSGG